MTSRPSLLLVLAFFALLPGLAAGDDGAFLSRPPGRFLAEPQLPGEAADLPVFGSTVAPAQGASPATAYFATPSGLFRLEGGSRWTRFGVAEGLPSTVARAVAIDGAGRVWCGTAAGPAVLDGQRWHGVAGTDGRPISADVWSICHDGPRSWIATDEGIFEVTGGRVVAQHTVKSAKMPENWISGVAADGKGIVWAAVWMGGLARWDGSKWTFFRDPDSSPGSDAAADDGLLSDAAASVAIDSSSAVWVGTSAGISRFDGWRWKDMYLGPVQYVEPTREGRTIMAGTPDGLLIFESGLMRRYHVDPAGLPAGSVSGWGSASARTPGALRSAEVFTAAADGFRVYVGTRRGLSVLELGR